MIPEASDFSAMAYKAVQRQGRIQPSLSHSKHAQGCTLLSLPRRAQCQRSPDDQHIERRTPSLPWTRGERSLRRGDACSQNATRATRRRPGTWGLRGIQSSSSLEVDERMRTRGWLGKSAGAGGDLTFRSDIHRHSPPLYRSCVAVLVGEISNRHFRLTRARPHDPTSMTR
jgi:hypothetical protein